MTKQKYKGQLLTRTKVKNNIKRYYNLSTKVERQRGKNWYFDAKYFCQILQQRYGHELYQIAGVVAALSPQTNWQENKRIAELFLQGQRDNLHNGNQMYKAELCLTASCELDIFFILTKDGKKTSYFYANILKPLLNNGTTIDRHALAVCFISPAKTRTLNDNEAQITKLQYEFFNQCYIEASNELGLNAKQLQAITWTSFRRLRGLPNEYNTKEL
jgi:hypothetical protein